MTNYNLFPDDAMGEKSSWITEWEIALFSYFQMLLRRRKIEKKKEKIFALFNILVKLFMIH